MQSAVPGIHSGVPTVAGLGSLADAIVAKVMNSMSAKSVCFMATSPLVAIMRGITNCYGHRGKKATVSVRGVPLMQSRLVPQGLPLQRVVLESEAVLDQGALAVAGDVVFARYCKSAYN